MSLSRVALTAVLVAAVAKPVRAASWDTDAKLIVTGIVVVSAGLATAVTLIVIHHKNNEAAITGCVIRGTTGVSITDEKNNRVYALSGDSSMIKPGERMTLEGKKSRQSHGTFLFQADKIVRDFGPCPP